MKGGGGQDKDMMKKMGGNLIGGREGEVTREKEREKSRGEGGVVLGQARARLCSPVP